MRGKSESRSGSVPVVVVFRKTGSPFSAVRAKGKNTSVCPKGTMRGELHVCLTFSPTCNGSIFKTDFAHSWFGG